MASAAPRKCPLCEQSRKDSELDGYFNNEPIVDETGKKKSYMCKTCGAPVKCGDGHATQNRRVHLRNQHNIDLPPGPRVKSVDRLSPVTIRVVNVCPHGIVSLATSLRSDSGSVVGHPTVSPHPEYGAVLTFHQNHLEHGQIVILSLTYIKVKKSGKQGTVAFRINFTDNSFQKLSETGNLMTPTIPAVGRKPSRKRRHSQDDPIEDHCQIKIPRDQHIHGSEERSIFDEYLPRQAFVPNNYAEPEQLMNEVRVEDLLPLTATEELPVPSPTQSTSVFSTILENFASANEELSTCPVNDFPTDDDYACLFNLGASDEGDSENRPVKSNDGDILAQACSAALGLGSAVGNSSTSHQLVIRETTGKESLQMMEPGKHYSTATTINACSSFPELRSASNRCFATQMSDSGIGSRNQSSDDVLAPSDPDGLKQEYLVQEPLDEGLFLE